MAWNVPSVFAALATLTAAQMNQIRDSLNAIGDPWTAYTSTPANFTVGNGTTTAAFAQAGKLAHFRIKFVFGSTSNMTGSPTFTLPVNATAARAMSARVLFYDTSATAFKGGFAFNSAAGTLNVRDDASAAITSAVPFTWATGDELVINGTYEVA